MDITKDTLDEVEELFDQADEDGDGQISLTEFRTLMVELDRRKLRGTIDAAFAKVDENHDGRIGFAEFRAWWLTA
jgi:Ca2+-binding EF-hand superfamily protein